MILHGQLCGNVGRRRDYFREGPVVWNGAFFFLRENFREGAAMELNLGCGHLCDDEFVAAFETCTISPAAFHHADHVRLAWIYAGRCGAKKAEETLLAGIRRFAARAGVPEKFQYTTTVAWSRLVAASRKNAKAENRFGKWIARHPEFLDRRLLDKYYLKHTLQSEPARSTWVAPDLAPLSCCLDSARFST
jgi:hypothetical protein